MAKPTRSFPIQGFQPIDGLKESTQLGGKLLQAKNVVLRPLGGFKGVPKYERLWGTGVSETMQAFYRRQTFSGFPSGVGYDNAARTANKTCAFLVKRQGKNSLVFYDLVSSECRGMFYLGDDGTYTSGEYDFTAGTPTVTVLAVGLDSHARWYGQRFFKAIYLGNGVDDNVIAQLGRSATPGIWRKAASNIAPSAPVISLVTPAASGNVQAYWTIPAASRTGNADLTFTAKVGLFPGLAGNNKIRVRIANNADGAALRSSLTGQGTGADPYYYTLVAGSTSANSSNTAVVNYVNADSRVTAILAASTSAPDATADLGTYGPTDLENGTGTGNSAGYSNRTITFYARYWDPGAENFGYEGVSSAISNTLIIPNTANNDIRVLVPVDSTAEGGRFGFLRLYMQFGESPDAVWLLINPDDPVPNGLTGTFARVGSTNAVQVTGTGWSANDVVRLTTTGTLPGGLSLATDYYLQSSNPGLNQWTLAAVLDGTATVLTDAGTGTHTLTLTKKCVQVGTQTPFLPAADGGEMFADQNRPLPHTLHAYSNEQVWRAGVSDFPERIYASKPGTSDEVVPEGCNLDDLSFITVLNQSNAGGTNKMTGLIASQNRIDCHYPTGITMFDPTETDQRNFTATGAGAINPTAVCTWEGKGQFFLGGDMQLRSQSVEQTGAGFAAAVANSQFAALTAAQFMRSQVALPELARNPQRVFLFPNVTDQHLYMSLPGLDGSLKMFGYDFLTNGIVGPFDYPKVYAAALMEPDRPEILFADEAGNLFVWDTANQNDHGDTFGTVSAFTPHSTGTPMPAQYNGYGYVDFNGSRYYQAYTSTLETGYLDLDGMDSRKAVTALLFRVVLGSRALVTATVTALGGETMTVSFSEAEFYGEVEHRINLFLGRTTSVKIKFEIVGAEQKAWVIRDLTALWVGQGKV